MWGGFPTNAGKPIELHHRASKRINLSQSKSELKKGETIVVKENRDKWFARRP